MHEFLFYFFLFEMLGAALSKSGIAAISWGGRERLVSNLVSPGFRHVLDIKSKPYNTLRLLFLSFFSSVVFIFLYL